MQSPKPGMTGVDFIIDEAIYSIELDGVVCRPVFHPEIFGRASYRTYDPVYHVHAHYHLILVSRGCCYLIIEGAQRALLEENTLLLINPDVPHTFAQVGGKEFEHTAILWEMLDGENRQSRARIQQLIDSDRTENYLYAKLSRLEAQELLAGYRMLQKQLNDYRRKRPYTPLAFAMILKMLELLLARSVPAPEMNHSSALLRQIELLTDDLLGDPKFGLKEIAARFGRTPHYLSRLFREHSGYSIPEFLTMRRMRRARKLLLNTQLPIAEIADRCGYTKPGYLSVVFRKNFGVTPLDYRRTAVSRPGPKSWRSNLSYKPGVIGNTYDGDLPLVED